MRCRRFCLQRCGSLRRDWCWLCGRCQRDSRGRRRRQWASISFLGTLIFLGDYGLMFWAEVRVPSGIAAVIMATIPVFIALADIAILRAHRMTLRLAAGLMIGLGGVAVLMSRSLEAGGRGDQRGRCGGADCGVDLLGGGDGADAKASAAGVEGAERGRADAGGRSDAGDRFDGAGRAARISCCGRCRAGRGSRWCT